MANWLWVLSAPRDLGPPILRARQARGKNIFLGRLQVSWKKMLCINGSQTPLSMKIIKEFSDAQALHPQTSENQCWHFKNCSRGSYCEAWVKKRLMCMER